MGRTLRWALLGLAATTLLVCVQAQPQAAAERSAASDRARDWKPDVKAAKRYARSRAGHVSFAFIDLEGRSHKFRAGETAALASVFKTMLLAAYLHRKSVRGRGLKGRDRDLLGPMIRRSDSVAATEVNRIVGGRAIERLAKRADMRRFSYDPDTWGLSRGTPRELARFIGRFDRYVPRRHRRYARNLLSSIKSSQRWGVGEVRPRGWKLYFKGGWGSGSGAVNHQVARYERGDCTISMALFTESNPSHDYGSQTLKGLVNRLTDDLRSKSGC